MKFMLTIIAIVLVLVPATMYAGTAATSELSIEFTSEGSGVASGNMWLARSSRNDVEVIGCSFKGEVDPDTFESWNWGWCRARDASGVQVLCLTYDDNMLDAMQAISPFSWVRFVFENATQDTDGSWIGDCTRFDISTQSLHLPLFTTKGKK